MANKIQDENYITKSLFSDNILSQFSAAKCRLIYIYIYIYKILFGHKAYMFLNVIISLLRRIVKIVIANLKRIQVSGDS